MPHDGDPGRGTSCVPALQLRRGRRKLTRNLDVAAEQTAIERSNAELRAGIDLARGSLSGNRPGFSRSGTSGQNQGGFRSALRGSVDGTRTGMSGLPRPHERGASPARPAERRGDQGRRPPSQARRPRQRGAAVRVGEPARAAERVPSLGPPRAGVRARGVHRGPWASEHMTYEAVVSLTDGSVLSLAAGAGRPGADHARRVRGQRAPGPGRPRFRDGLRRRGIDRAGPGAGGVVGHRDLHPGGGRRAGAWPGPCASTGPARTTIPYAKPIHGLHAVVDLDDMTRGPGGRSRGGAAAARHRRLPRPCRYRAAA